MNNTENLQIRRAERLIQIGNIIWKTLYVCLLVVLAAYIGLAVFAGVAEINPVTVNMICSLRPIMLWLRITVLCMEALLCGCYYFTGSLVRSYEEAVNDTDERSEEADCSAGYQS